MNKRYTKAIVLAGLAALLITSMAFARGGYGNGGGQGMGSQLAPEKQVQLNKMIEAYQDDTESLREDLWAKHTLLEALSRNDNADTKELTALIDDMKNIRNQLNDKREAFEDKVEGEFGIQMRGGYGMGGGKGIGGGRGQGGCGGVCPRF